LESASPDLLREMIKGFAQRMMDAEVEAVCGAGYGGGDPGAGETPGNGYRRAGLGIPGAGTVELAVPKLRQGTYYPGVAAGAPPPGRSGRWPTVVATVVPAGGSRRGGWRKLGGVPLALTKLSKVRRSASWLPELDDMVSSFRSRPGPGTPGRTRFCVDRTR